MKEEEEKNKNLEEILSETKAQKKAWEKIIKGLSKFKDKEKK